MLLDLETVHVLGYLHWSQTSLNTVNIETIGKRTKLVKSSRWALGIS